MEEWRKIPSVPGLSASSFGRIQHDPWLRKMPRGGEYLVIYKPWFGAWSKSTNRFTIRLRGKSYRVAALICEAFHGEKPFPRAVCMHLNEDSRDNRPENLAWGTQKQNLNFPGFKAYCAARVGDNNPHTKGKRRQMSAGA